MEFQKEFEIFKICGQMLQTAKYEEMEIEDITALITSIETQLWRHKIILIRE